MKTGTGIVGGVSVSYSDATVEEIETAAAESQSVGVETLLAEPGVSEAFVLQTCNRAEAYVVSEDAETARAALDRYVVGVDEGVVDRLDHEGSLRHLLRVACGLESLILGEDQILGQLREAYDDARGAGGTGPVLDDALLKALHVGERAREETAINEGVLSLGSAAVRLAGAEGRLEEATALVVGAGEMGTLAARSLDGTVDQIIVANRTVQRAECVAAELDVETTAVGLETLPIAVAEADVVIAATGSDTHLLEAENLDHAGETLVVDIAQPRDVDPEAAEIDGIDVHDLDALEAVTDETRTHRREAAEAVETMIGEEFDHLLSQYKRKRADEVIAAMYEGAERVKARELHEAFSRLEANGEFTDDQREIVESMADALVGQLLSAPTESIRNAAENDDWSTINAALQLFGPGLEPEPAELPDAPGEIPPGMRQRMPDDLVESLGEDE